MSFNIFSSYISHHDDLLWKAGRCDNEKSSICVKRFCELRVMKAKKGSLKPNDYLNCGTATEANVLKYLLYQIFVTTMTWEIVSMYKLELFL
jgi:hypothetical protein